MIEKIYTWGIHDDQAGIAQVTGVALEAKLGSNFRRVVVQSDYETVVGELQAEKPDVVIVDWHLQNGRKGGDLVRAVSPLLPSTRFVLYTGALTGPVMRLALAVDFSAIVSKSDPVDSLVNAVRVVAIGNQRYFSPMAEAIYETIRELGAEKTLTVREMEVMWAIAAGDEPLQICERLGISAQTFRNHVTNIRGKTGAVNHVQIARYVQANLGDAQWARVTT